MSSLDDDFPDKPSDITLQIQQLVPDGAKKYELGPYYDKIQRLQFQIEIKGAYDRRYSIDDILTKNGLHIQSVKEGTSFITGRKKIVVKGTYPGANNDYKLELALTSGRGEEIKLDAKSEGSYSPFLPLMRAISEYVALIKGPDLK